MAPNQMIAVLVTVVSVGWYYFNLKTDSTVSDVEELSKPKKLPPKKLNEFTERINELVSSCPFANAQLKLEYLTSGKNTQEIVKAEMMRLGEVKERAKTDG